MTVLARCSQSDATVRKRTEIQRIAKEESTAIAGVRPDGPMI
jgi:hypothetical protein